MAPGIQPNSLGMHPGNVNRRAKELSARDAARREAKAAARRVAVTEMKPTATKGSMEKGKRYLSRIFRRASDDYASSVLPGSQSQHKEDVLTTLPSKPSRNHETVLHGNTKPRDGFKTYRGTSDNDRHVSVVGIPSLDQAPLRSGDTSPYSFPEDPRVSQRALGLPAASLPTLGANVSSPEAYGWSGGHRILEPTDEEPMMIVQHLGHGSLGVVEEVRRSEMFPSLVRKRVKVPTQKRLAEKITAIIEEEIATLRRLHHPNIASFVGSYEDKRNTRHSSYCLLMLPVGENDLDGFLTAASDPDLQQDLKYQYIAWIQSWYADLAAALAFMHAKGVRHQDIKPSNIIHKGNKIFFTDFSSCGIFQVGYTTSTANPVRSTAMYAAPEADLSKDERYGRSFDIFALGCVFCEMLTVETGRTVSAFHESLSSSEDPRLRYSEHLPAVREWFGQSENSFLNCVFAMLLEDRHLRPSADDVVDYCARRRDSVLLGTLLLASLLPPHAKHQIISVADHVQPVQGAIGRYT